MTATFNLRTRPWWPTSQAPLLTNLQRMRSVPWSCSGKSPCWPSRESLFVPGQRCRHGRDCRPAPRSPYGGFLEAGRATRRRSSSRRPFLTRLRVSGGVRTPPPNPLPPTPSPQPPPPRGEGEKKRRDCLAPPLLSGEGVGGRGFETACSQTANGFTCPPSSHPK